MDKKEITQNAHIVSCEICLSEIPISSAINEESCDYVMYFCGLDCYDRWLNTKSQQQNDQGNQ